MYCFSKASTLGFFSHVFSGGVLFVLNFENYGSREKDYVVSESHVWDLVTKSRLLIRIIHHFCPTEPTTPILGFVHVFLLGMILQSFNL